MASLFSRLMGRGAPSRAPQPPEQKRSAVGPLVAFHEVGRPVWTRRSGTALTEAGYRRNAIVYRCVRLISEAAASVALSVFEGEHEDASHPIAALLARPNPREAGSQFFEAVYGHLLLSGNAYLECVALAGVARELYALRPDRMKVVPGPDGWPQAYEYRVGAETYTFNQEGVAQPPILHLKLFDPLDDHYGLPPLMAGQIALDTHNVAAGWNKALLDNSARPSGALVYAADGANMSDQQFDRLKEELEQAFQGPVNAGRPILLEGGLDWKPLSMSPKDMDFQEAKAAAAREIALAFGVPPLLLGLPGDNTYANYAEANRAFWRQSVLPLVNRTLGSLAHWLAPSFGDGLRLEPDLDRIEALASERCALWQRVGAADFLDRDEKRAAVGYEPGGGVPPGGGDIADEAGEVTKLKARLHDLELRYSDTQPRDYHGRWTSGGGDGPMGQSAQPSPSGKPPRGAQVAFGGPSDNMMSNADGFMFPAGSESQTAQLRDDELKPRPVQFDGRGYPINLLEEKEYGGHTIEDHVGRSDDEIIRDMRADQRNFFFIKKYVGIDGDFESLESATKLVNSTVSRNTQSIEDWLKNGSEDRLTVSSNFSSPTGREIFFRNPDANPIVSETYFVRAVLKKTDKNARGFYVLTAFPTNYPNGLQR